MKETQAHQQCVSLWCMCFVCVRVHTHSEGLTSLLIYTRVFFIKKVRTRGRHRNYFINYNEIIDASFWFNNVFKDFSCRNIYKKNILSYTKLKEKLTLIKLAAVVSTGTSQHEGLDISINTECWQRLKLNLALTFLYYSFIFSLF